ncbi:translation elongation factor EF-1beta [Providencia alcalifaciens]|nr:translation elongation factor EF-1beta [Providencia alcalifaciens]
MSDKKEITTLSIKISVDSTDLDKLEAQLKRIAGLMVNAGLKEPTSVGFSADMFFVKNGQTFIDSAFITSGTVSPAIKYTISGLHSDDYKEDLKQAVKQAIRPVIRNHIKVERVNEKQTGNVLRGGVRVDEGESAIANLDNAIAEIKAVDATQYIKELSTEFAKHNDNSIDNHAPNLFQEVEALKETVAAMLSEKEQERASIASLKCAITDSNHAHAEAIRQLAIDMQRSRSGFC